MLPRGCSDANKPLRISPDSMPRGTYIIALRLAEPVTVNVGALGTHRFDSELYKYVGSAEGPGGFKRVDRHRRVANGDNDARHWHIDYLLAEAEIVESWSYPASIECDLANRMDGRPVTGFGASDCHCSTHLFYDNLEDM